MSTTREIGAVLPLSAVLAARLLAKASSTRARMVPALRAGPGRLLRGPGLGSGPPARPRSQRQQLGSWLAARHLDYGLAGYSGGEPASPWAAAAGRCCAQQQGQARRAGRLGDRSRSWYDPRRYRATFAALLGTPPCAAEWPTCGWRSGRRPRSTDVGRYTVLTWRHENLLTRLR